jgi:microcystin-dependent protein
MTYPARFSRRTSYKQAENAGSTTPSTASLDAEFNDLVSSTDQLNTFVRGITTATGQLTSLASATAQALVASQRFVATASQTVFLTTIPWQVTFTSYNVLVYANGALIDPATVTVASGTGAMLQVTLGTGLSVGTVVLIAAFEAGAGILTTLTSTAGAGLIGILDTGGLFSGATVEAALAEAMTAVNLIITNIGSYATILRSTGAVPMAANFPMGSNRITGLADGVAAQDAATVNQLAAFTSVLADIQTNFIRKDGTVAFTAAQSMGTHKITDLSPGTLGTDAVNLTQLQNAIILPPGMVVPFAGATPPAGWLLCDGSAVSRTTYATLFAAIGAAYGPGDSVNTFNVPAMGGRVPVGAGTSAGDSVDGSVFGAPGTTPAAGLPTTNRGAGAWGGGEKHKLIEAELAAHIHAGGVALITGGVTGAIVGPTTGSGGTYVNSAGSDTAHNNLPPFVVFNYIIKT